jgi:alpha-glucosidase
MRSTYLLLIGVGLCGCASAVVAAEPISAVSPDGHLRIEFALQSLDGQSLEGTRSVPMYRATIDTTEVVASSPLGMLLAGGERLGGACEVVSTTSRTIHEDYVQITGKRREVTVQATEVVIRLREIAAPQRLWEVVLRAENDGVAFRYQFPQQVGWDALTIEQELTEFRVPSHAVAVSLPLNGYTTPYEKRYLTKPLDELPQMGLYGLPLLIDHPGEVWTAITEADMHEYAGLYLARTNNGVLAARLSPLPGSPGIAVRAPLPHASPWRVIMAARRLGQLVESDLVLNLNQPCAIPNPAWIHSGKTTFPWWNGFYEERVNFTPGLNTATAKHYIDFCAEAGIPYHSLDGIDNTAWYGGPINPYRGADITQAVDGLDLPAVLDYAKSKGVRIRLWMNWKGAEQHMERAFPLYREWGIEGVMLDFMDRDDQEMNRFVRKAVAWAAENQLTVTLHGCPKPTGLERTFPNLLTHEGVMNLEYDKWDKRGITPDHEVTVSMTRMLAGPLDFHQGSFRTVQLADFQPRYHAPLVIGTPARTLASYVVYQNHLSMIADYPTAYRGHPALAPLVAIPTTWDDTQVLHAKVGEHIVIARRSGDEWHLGAMNHAEPATLPIPLNFLGTGRYQAVLWKDLPATPHGITPQRSTVTSSDTLELQLAPASGAYYRFTVDQP